MRRILTVALLLATAATAHWDEPAGTPDWAQRGKLRWGLLYSRTSQPLAELLARHHQTVVQGSHWTPETAAWAGEHGLCLMPYVCSRTYTVTEIEKNPALAQAMLLREDRSEYLAYNNPVRRYGSLFAPAWTDYVHQRTNAQAERPGTRAIFYDNAFFPGDDHRPEAIAAWTAWARGQGLGPGEDVPLHNTGERAPQHQLFVAEKLTEYHRRLREFCHAFDPTLLTAPNLGHVSASGLYAGERGAYDLVFYETATHPPFRNNGFLYKIGLAISHGRGTGMLAYLPANIAEQRGTPVWNEGMHHWFNPSSPLPEEFALAAAEGAANGGSYVVNYSLFPSLPITDLTDPFNLRIHRELERSYDFLAANEALYQAARPSPETAILFSTLSDIHDRTTVGLWNLADRLAAAGLPYEIITDSDLAEGTVSARTVLLRDVRYMSEATAAGLLRFVEQGGRAILTGGFAIYDPVGRSQRPASAEKLLASLRFDSSPLTQWEAIGYEPEADRMKAVLPEASLSRTFAGTAGRYLAHLELTDESDGTSSFSFSAAGQTVLEARLDAEDDRRHWFTTAPFELKPGDALEYRAQFGGGEPARISAIVLTAASANDALPVGRGELLYLPEPPEQLPAKRLAELFRPSVRRDGPSTVAINRLDLPTENLNTIHLLNYDFRYQVTHENLYLSDDGSAEGRMYYNSPSTVVRKRIAIPERDQLGRPILQVHSFATADTTAPLRVTVNGQLAGEIPAEESRSNGWHELELDPALLREQNVIDLIAAGQVDGMGKWWQISLDTDTREGNSEYSPDGVTFSGDDLSPQLKEQTGEYLIRIRDDLAGGPPADPDNQLVNPGFEQVRVPHSETTLDVIPAEGVEILVDGAVQPALLISPEAPPVAVTGRTVGETAIYTVPRVEIYSVLVLGEQAKLAAIEATQNATRSWELPPVTTPLRAETTGWNAYGDGFRTEATVVHSGERSVTCTAAAADEVKGLVQELTFDHDRPRPVTVTAWSKAEQVGGPPDAHYSIYLDAVCTDGTVIAATNTPFETGSHDWQQATVRLAPPAPLKSLKVYLLFRRHTGQVWFDEARLTVE